MSYIIKFKEGTDSALVTQYLEQYSCTIIDDLTNLRDLFLVECSIEPEVTDIIDSIDADADNDIQLLSHNTLTIDNNDDLDWWKLAVMRNPHLDEDTYSIDRRGSESIVYLIDSGVNSSHPDFVGSTISNLYTFNGSFEDTRGHGTALASVINGRTCGITDAHIKSVKIFDAVDKITLGQLVSAFNAVSADYQENTQSIGIVNISWSIEYNSTIDFVISQLAIQGLVVVVAAGNSGIPIADVTPASNPDVTVIGSHDIDFKPSDFSNYSGPLNITNSTVNYGRITGWAPGEYIKVALGDDYDIISGTSVSCAIMSAVMASNGHLLVKSDDSIPDTQARTYYLVGFSLSNNTLMTLDAPYSLERSHSATIINDKNGVNGEFLPAPTIWTLKLHSGQSITKQLYHKMSYDHVELEEFLPSGLDLDLESGWLTGTVISSETQPQVYHVPVTVVKTNGDVLPTFINIIVLPENTDVDNFDLPIEVTALFTCSAKLIQGTNTYHCEGHCDNAWWCQDCLSNPYDPKDPNFLNCACGCSLD